MYVSNHYHIATHMIGSPNLSAVGYIDMARFMHLFNAGVFENVQRQSARFLNFDNLRRFADRHREDDPSSDHKWSKIFLANHFLEMDRVIIPAMCVAHGIGGETFLFTDYSRPDPIFHAGPLPSYSAFMIFNQDEDPATGTHFFLCGKNQSNSKTGVLEFRPLEMMYKTATGANKHIRLEGITPAHAAAGLCYAAHSLRQITAKTPLSPTENSKWMDMDKEVALDYFLKRSAAPYHPDFFSYPQPNPL